MPFLRSARVLACLLACCTQAAPSFAQNTNSPKHGIPHARRLAGKLPNGVRYILEHTNTRDTSIRVIVNGGISNVPSEDIEISHLVEHIVARSLKEESSPLRRLMDANSSSFVAATGNKFAIYDFKIDSNPSVGMPRELASSLRTSLFTPKIDAEIVDSERRSVIGEKTKNPNDLITSHAISKFITGVDGLPEWQRGLDIISRATPDQVSSFHRRWYVPGNITVIAVGNIDPEKWLADIISQFGSIPGKSGSVASSFRMPVLYGRKIDVLIAPDAKDERIVLQAISKVSRAKIETVIPDFVKREMLSEIARQLFEIRAADFKKSDITAEIYRYSFSYEPTGVNAFSILHDKSTLYDTAYAMAVTLRQLQEIGVEQSELDRARKRLAVGLAMGRSNPDEAVDTYTGYLEREIAIPAFTPSTEEKAIALKGLSLVEVNRFLAKFISVGQDLSMIVYGDAGSNAAEVVRRALRDAAKADIQRPVPPPYIEKLSDFGDSGSKHAVSAQVVSPNVWRFQVSGGDVIYKKVPDLTEQAISIRGVGYVDRTPDILKKVQARYFNMRVMAYPKSIGLENSLRHYEDTGLYTRRKSWLFGSIGVGDDRSFVEVEGPAVSIDELFEQFSMLVARRPNSPIGTYSSGFLVLGADTLSGSPASAERQSEFADTLLAGFRPQYILLAGNVDIGLIEKYINRYAANGSWFGSQKPASVDMSLVPSPVIVPGEILPAPGQTETKFRFKKVSRVAAEQRRYLFILNSVLHNAFFSLARSRGIYIASGYCGADNPSNLASLTLQECGLAYRSMPNEEETINRVAESVLRRISLGEIGENEFNEAAAAEVGRIGSRLATEAVAQFGSDISRKDGRVVVNTDSKQIDYAGFIKFCREYFASAERLVTRAVGK